MEKTENKSDFEKEYFDFVSSMGQELLGDYLCNLSRQKQKALLISAAITILVSFTVITPVEGSFAGLKFNFTSVKVFPLLSGVVCLYYVVTYFVGIVQDWYRFKYQRIPIAYKLQEIKQELVKQMNEKRKRWTGFIVKLLKNLNNENKAQDRA